MSETEALIALANAVQRVNEALTTVVKLDLTATVGTHTRSTFVPWATFTEAIREIPQIDVKVERIERIDLPTVPR